MNETEIKNVLKQIYKICEKNKLNINGNFEFHSPEETSDFEVEIHGAWPLNEQCNEIEVYKKETIHFLSIKI
jgi:hypothetical protein